MFIILYDFTVALIFGFCIAFVICFIGVLIYFKHNKRQKKLVLLKSLRGDFEAAENPTDEENKEGKASDDVYVEM